MYIYKPFKKIGTGYFFAGNVFVEIGEILETNKEHQSVYGRAWDTPVHQYRFEVQDCQYVMGDYGTIGDFEFEMLEEDTPQHRLVYVLRYNND